MYSDFDNAALKSLQKLASEETLDLFVDTRQDQLLSLLETMPSSTLDDEKKKAKAYQKYLNTVSDDRMKKACDLLIGAGIGGVFRSTRTGNVSGL